MKEKGFSQIAAIFLVVLLIGLGLYFYKQKTNIPIQPASSVTTESSTTPTPSPTPIIFEPTQNGYKKFTNQQDGYEMELPNSWVVWPSYGSSNTVFANLPPEGDFSFTNKTISLSINKYEPSNSYIKELFDLKIKQKLDQDKATLTKIAEQTISSFPAVKISSSSAGKPVDSYFTTVYYVKTNNAFYGIEFAGINSKILESNNTLLDNIATSFKITQ